MKLWYKSVYQFIYSIIKFLHFTWRYLTLKAPVVISTKFLLAISMLNQSKGVRRINDMITQDEFSW